MNPVRDNQDIKMEYSNIKRLNKNRRQSAELSPSADRLFLTG